MKNIFLIAFLVSLFFENIYAQYTVSGFVRDAETRDELPAANIQIIGTLRGTITNQDGRFNLELDRLPVTLHITYIGYETRDIQINEEKRTPLDILLKPVILESEAIIVTAEDPAMGIMREVIKRKLQWREKINTYEANAYSRLVLENDSGIVSVAESISEAFWDKKKGPREVIKSKRQTNNMSDRSNFATVSYVPNFYDDDIEINGFKIIGPTNRSAFDYYEYKLIGRRKLGDKIVYDIEVIPTSKLQPTFIGKISVLDEEFAMIEVDLKPSSTILFPQPIQEWNLYYKQQFSNYGKEFWLPVDVRIEGNIKIGFTGLQFPRISYNQLSHLDDYKINVELPDSLYGKDDIFSADSTTIASDSLFSISKEVVPLSMAEEKAYEELDSTMTLEKAFRPTGALSRFIDVETEDNNVNGDGKSIFDGFGPQLWFNRVDELHLGVTYKREFLKQLESGVSVSYKTGLKRWGYSAEIEYSSGRHRSNQIKAKYYVGSESQYDRGVYSKTLVSPLPLFGLDDYFDYYWKKSFNTSYRMRIRKIDSGMELGLNDEWHSSLSKTNDYNFVKSDKKQRLNPGVSNGHLRSITLELAYGDEPAPFGIVGQSGISLLIEHSDRNLFKSDFDFTSYLLTIDWRINTFLKRRLLPNALDLHFILGTASGSLPVQRYFGIDGNLCAFAPYGTFRSLAGRHYSGEKVAAVFWEHNFRTVPFELIGLDYLARKGWAIIIHGAHGRTWIDAQDLARLGSTVKYIDRFHQEAGVSLNGLFGILRIDFTQRLDQKGAYLGAGFTRFF
jgi:hypothetical protein